MNKLKTFFFSLLHGGEISNEKNIVKDKSLYFTLHHNFGTSWNIYFSKTRISIKVFHISVDITVCEWQTSKRNGFKHSHVFSHACKGQTMGVMNAQRQHFRSICFRHSLQ